VPAVLLPIVVDSDDVEVVVVVVVAVAVLTRFAGGDVGGDVIFSVPVVSEEAVVVVIF
jgi:hypothetical protein